MRKCCLALLLALVVSPPARAQSGVTPEQALSTSLIVTLVPSVTVLLAPFGLWWGPAAGYFRAGMAGRAWTGIGIRTVGLAGMVAAFGICGWDCGPGSGSYTAAWIVFGIGTGVFVVDAVYDIATVRTNVRHHGARKVAPPVTLVPTWSPARGLGLAVRLAF